MDGVPWQTKYVRDGATGISSLIPRKDIVIYYVVTGLRVVLDLDTASE